MHAEVHHRVDLDRDVVARDHVLRRHVEHHGAQVDPHHLLDARNQQEDQPRPLDLPEAAELEHHAALVLAQDAERIDSSRTTSSNSTHAESEARIPITVRPCPGDVRVVDRDLAASVRGAPSPAPVVRACSGARLRTCQCSPCTRAQPWPRLSARSPSTAPGCRPASWPLTTGRRRAFSAMPATEEHEAALADALTAAISASGMPKPGTSVSISISAPITKAIDAAEAEHAEAGQERLGDHERDAEQDQRQPGVVHRQHLQRVQAEQQADRRRPRRAARCRGWRTRRSARRCRSSSGSARCWDR